ncbi:Suppressor of cytokine signaling 7 [Frankliniella fusca]|uniref:Suppressor of cytokine signaling 7 n=1 Tax=Frankliniella fusca TaxID=407009 RepID=A0AAE1LMC2_9NEOP|nr:Suppressor of cytokine signaling 7 [Frankliniella fusca]
MELENDRDERSASLTHSFCNSHTMCRGNLSSCGSRLSATEAYECRSHILSTQPSDKAYDSSNDLSSWSEPLAIKPPPEFQDSSPYSSTPQDSPFTSPPVTLGRSIRPYTSTTTSARMFPARLHPGVPEWLEKMAVKMVTQVLEEALLVSGEVSWSIHCSEDCHPRRKSEKKYSLTSEGQQSQLLGFRYCWTPELPYMLCRPASRSSLSSRLSSSHNSLSVPAANRVDDSSFITSAMSHEVLSTGDICDMYNVPVDCDVYAVPVDMVRPPVPVPPQRQKRQRHQRRKRKQPEKSEMESSKGRTLSSHTMIQPRVLLSEQASQKRHNRPGRSASMECATPGEPIHMTLAEVRRYLSSLYSSSSDSSECRKKPTTCLQSRLPNISKAKRGDGSVTIENIDDNLNVTYNNPVTKSHRKSTFSINVRNKKCKESVDTLVLASPEGSDCMLIPEGKTKRGMSFSSTLKQTFCNMFRIRRLISPEHAPNRRRTIGGVVDDISDSVDVHTVSSVCQQKARFSTRALPPLPARDIPLQENSSNEEALVQDDILNEGEPSVDFASSIEKVKDYGWYWGPISGEAAEKILSNEPDGSFIVRDSSDDHYIFSLTFKLNSCVRHVRIEQDQGNFSFGSCTKFKSHTIVDFIENAVEHSRSGRYLFFLHRRPVLGPMRVQLLHPVSRFKQVQSLQHMCRFVILKVVRRDLISSLPLPRRVLDYLSTPHYYSEQLAEEEKLCPSSPSSNEEQGLYPYMGSSNI